MLDIKWLRDDIDKVVEALKKRHLDFDSALFQDLEQKRKVLQNELQTLQSIRNTQSKEIGRLKADGKPVDEVLKTVADLGDKLADIKAKTTEIQQQIHTILTTTPNIPHSSVPMGKNDTDNDLISTWGGIPQFTFAIKDHVDLGADELNFDYAAKISAARFSLLQGNVAKLHRALIQFMLETHIKQHGYREIYVPYLVNAQALFGTGQLPKFAEDLFKTTLDGEGGGKRPLYLIPTAEVPVTNMVAERILMPAELPLKYVAHTPCFRSEAGSYGKDTRGLIRQHQFEKVELVQIVKQDESYQALEALTGHAEEILKQLELPYRKVVLCGGDLGFSAAKTYDLEVWMPGQNAYREISSCSNFEAFQARRMKARWKNKETNNTEWVHTLNGSGLAVGRTLAALMENHQQVDGSIAIPEALRSFMGGLATIKP